MGKLFKTIFRILTADGKEVEVGARSQKEAEEIFYDDPTNYGKKFRWGGQQFIANGDGQNFVDAYLED